MDPIFNHDEFIGKTVGTRKPPVDALRYSLGLQRIVNTFGGIRVPRGVFRFHSHEEADAWLTDHLTRQKGR